jgi:hypothetical protein
MASVMNEQEMEARIREFRDAVSVIRKSLRNDRFERARRAVENLDNKFWKTLNELEGRSANGLSQIRTSWVAQPYDALASYERQQGWTEATTGAGNLRGGRRQHHERSSIF